MGLGFGGEVLKTQNPAAPAMPINGPEFGVLRRAFIRRVREPHTQGTNALGKCWRAGAIGKEDFQNGRKQPVLGRRETAWRRAYKTGVLHLYREIRTIDIIFYMIEAI